MSYVPKQGGRDFNNRQNPGSTKINNLRPSMQHMNSNDGDNYYENKGTGSKSLNDTYCNSGNNISNRDSFYKNVNRNRHFIKPYQEKSNYYSNNVRSVTPQDPLVPDIENLRNFVISQRNKFQADFASYENENFPQGKTTSVSNSGINKEQQSNKSYGDKYKQNSNVSVSASYVSRAQCGMNSNSNTVSHINNIPTEHSGNGVRHSGYVNKSGGNNVNNYHKSHVYNGNLHSNSASSIASKGNIRNTGGMDYDTMGNSKHPHISKPRIDLSPVLSEKQDNSEKSLNTDRKAHTVLINKQHQSKDVRKGNRQHHQMPSQQSNMVDGFRSYCYVTGSTEDQFSKHYPPSVSAHMNTGGPSIDAPSSICNSSNNSAVYISPYSSAAVSTNKNTGMQQINTTVGKPSLSSVVRNGPIKSLGSQSERAVVSVNAAANLGNGRHHSCASSSTSSYSDSSCNECILTTGSPNADTVIGTKVSTRNNSSSSNGNVGRSANFTNTSNGIMNAHNPATVTNGINQQNQQHEQYYTPPDPPASPTTSNSSLSSPKLTADLILNTKSKKY